MKMIKILFGILATTMALAIQVQAQSFLTNGLLAYYPFNGNVEDASGNGNNGTNYGATFTQDRFGFTNGAIYFNSSAYVLTGFFPPLGSAGCTFSGWFNVPPTSSTMTLMFYGGKNTYAGDRFELGINVGGPFYVDPDGGAFETANSYANSEWHSFVVVVPTNAATSNVLVYMDGTLQANLSGTSGLLINTATNYPLQFGELWQGLRPLTGALDDVRIYNRPLGSNEVAALYAFESGLPTPQLTQDITNSYVVVGQNVTFGVSVSSTTPVSYQWYFLPASNADQAGAYSETIAGFVYGVVVTNAGFGYGNIPNISFTGGGGSGASAFATVSNGVVIGITVTNAGYGYTNAPAVVIGPPDGYVYGQTNSTLIISNADEDTLGNYFVVVSNSNGSVTSSVVYLTLLYPPSITNQPQDQVVNAYGTASFDVGASGTTPLSYQWLFQSTNIPNGDDSNLIVTNVTPDNLGQYAVIVTNDYGCVTSSVANLIMEPFIVNPFNGLDTYWGLTNTLVVVAWGTGPLNYQWFDNGVAIPDATNQMLTLASVQFTNSGLYSVVVSSPLGSVTNPPEQVVVNPAGVSLRFSPTLNISGVVGYSYIIQSSTNLANINAWVTLTNLTLTQPVQLFVDTNVDASSPIYPNYFYRVLPGQ
jgi:hypothetical protein